MLVVRRKAVKRGESEQADSLWRAVEVKRSASVCE